MPYEECDDGGNNDYGNDADGRYRAAPIVPHDNVSIVHLALLLYKKNYVSPLYPNPGKRKPSLPRRPMAMWSWIGLISSLALGAVAALALGRAATPGSHHAGDYGMTPRSHARFAYLCLAFAATFAASLIWPPVPSVPILAAFALAGTLYLSSFVRGFADDDAGL
ncbi:MAG: hypothetical protein NVS1B14_05470 [Vulcanimicrobiaceae bacterium]